MAEQAQIGLIGLAVMGRNLALNIADHGYPIAVFNRTTATTEQFMASELVQSKPVIAAHDLGAFVQALARPRAILLMVKAGAPVDEQIEALLPLLEPGDLIIDGGNAHFADTMRRDAMLSAKGLRFLGTGISGGEEGARHGPSIMPGGTPAAFARVADILLAIAAKVGGEPCCAHIGPDGAGHFVKMIHNGIEYADMQLIAETYALMRGMGLDYPAMQACFAEWQRGDLESYLIEITADILTRHDPDTGQPMAEVILDRAGQKGTGRWAVVAAMDLGIAAPTIAEAVAARSLSALKDERLRASGLIAGPPPPAAAQALPLAKLKDALLAAKICAYAQGFAVMRAASHAHGWQIDFATLAKIWRGGCIIRARFLERIMEAFGRDSDLANLLLDRYFRDLLQRSQTSWREVVGFAAVHGIATPALSSALAYFDGYRAARLPANLIQAQRDYFGAHTYERVDREGVFHSDWPSL